MTLLDMSNYHKNAPKSILGEEEEDDDGFFQNFRIIKTMRLQSRESHLKTRQRRTESKLPRVEIKEKDWIIDCVVGLFCRVVVVRGWHLGSWMGTPIQASSLGSSFPAGERYQRNKKQVVSLAQILTETQKNVHVCVFIILVLTGI